MLEASLQPARLMELAAPTPSMCTWHHCSPYAPEPKWSVNPPNVHALTSCLATETLRAMGRPPTSIGLCVLSS